MSDYIWTGANANWSRLEWVGGATAECSVWRGIKRNGGCFLCSASLLLFAPRRRARGMKIFICGDGRRRIRAWSDAGGIVFRSERERDRQRRREPLFSFSTRYKYIFSPLRPYRLAPRADDVVCFADQPLGNQLLLPTRIHPSKNYNFKSYNNTFNISSIFSSLDKKLEILIWIKWTNIKIQKINPRCSKSIFQKLHP